MTPGPISRGPRPSHATGPDPALAAGDPPFAGRRRTAHPRRGRGASRTPALRQGPAAAGGGRAPPGAGRTPAESLAGRRPDRQLTAGTRPCTPPEHLLSPPPSGGGALFPL